MAHMKKLVAIVMMSGLVVGCSQTSSQATFTVPRDCNQQRMIDAFSEQVPDSKYVPTQWQPAEGTDLKAIYDKGGIACTYGIEVAEVGGTVMWANVDKEFWNERAQAWKTYGQTSIDIPGIDESAAYISKEESTSADEMHVWGVNVLIGDLWIQLNATFLQTIEEAVPLIQAAIDVAQNQS